MKKFFLLSTLASTLAHATPAGDINLTPTSLKLKVYKMAVSTSGLCTNLVTVVDNGATPSEVDFTQDPALGSGSIADGTYPCIVIEFADAVVDDIRSAVQRSSPGSLVSMLPESSTIRMTVAWAGDGPCRGNGKNPVANRRHRRAPTIRIIFLPTSAGAYADIG